MMDGDSLMDTDSDFTESDLEPSKNVGSKKDVLVDYDIIALDEEKLRQSRQKPAEPSPHMKRKNTAEVSSSGQESEVETSDQVSEAEAYTKSNGSDAHKVPSVQQHSNTSLLRLQAGEGQNSVVSSTVIETDSGSDFVDIKFVKGNVSSVPGPPPVVCPRVNCPEKLVICLDLNEELSTTTFRSRSGDKYSGLELAKRAIRMFLLHKSQMNPGHQFALVVIHDEAAMLHPLTPSPLDILCTLEETEMATQPSGPLDLAQLFHTVQENTELPEIDGDPTIVPPPFVLRVWLVYGRSHSMPVNARFKAQRELEASPHFFTDVLYIHEPPSQDNQCEEIFHSLCDLDHNGLSYIFEQSKYTPILNSGAKLLAHPLQRPRQLQANYKIGNGPVLSHGAKEDSTA